MATRKKTTRRARSTASTSGGATGIESMNIDPERSAEIPPTELLESSREATMGGAGTDGMLFRVRQLISEHPLLAVIGVAGLAFTVALAARD